MLDGFFQVNRPDLEDSKRLVDQWAYKFTGFKDAIDLGAGIGRICKEILLPRFKQVDLLEQSPKLIGKAHRNVP